MHQSLGKPIETAVDGENIPIQFDLAYPLRGPLPDAIEYLRECHGEDLFLLPISGSSCGGGIMQATAPDSGNVIGLRLDPPVEPRIRLVEQAELAQVEQDEILIDAERRRVSAGAAITLAQLNQALRDELGLAYRVTGADLTSYQYAAVGATFMTGGMGPQRRYFSDSVIAAAVYDGHSVQVIEGDRLPGYAGTYGWTGLVTAVECRFYEFPSDEIAFTLPVSDDPQALASLLARLSPFTRLQLGSGIVRSAHDETDLLLGIEHVSCDSMQPLLNQGQSNPSSRRALDLQQKCRQADAQGLLFINGLCTRTADEFLMRLVDDSDAEMPCIAGIALEYAELFADPEEMRDLREAIPYAARMQTPQYRHLYKNHTDAVIRIHPGKEATVMAEIWRINCDYVASVETLFAGKKDMHGEILVYGHLNPQGVDPHNRVTMACDDIACFEQTRNQLVELRAQFYRALVQLCNGGDASFIGGEKTADSEREIFAALGGPHHAPQDLYDRYQRQRQTVQDAAPMFNWRAPSLYR